MRPRHLIVFALAGLFLVPTLSAQEGNQTAFAPYACQFDRASNSATIQAALLDAERRPLDAANLGVVVAPVDGEPLGAQRVQLSVPSPRPPLQMVLVLDTTDTVPLEEVVGVISTELAPRLEVEDQVALITFSEEIAPVTQFYTDKNRLINEHMIDLLPLEGDNRLYDAIDEAVRAFPFRSASGAGQQRRVVLVLTDSGRRDIPQIESARLIAQAQRAGVQVYPIAFFTRDQPDLSELQAIANETRGVTWFYTEERNSRSSIQTAVGGFLAQFTQALSGEVNIRISMEGLVPDASGRQALDITLTLPDGSVQQARVSCPLELIQHSIRFSDPPPKDSAILGTLDLAVELETPLPSDQRRVIFRVNDEVVQNSANTRYRFNAADFAPGLYRISAQLWDSSNATLASTQEEVTLYAQQTLTLRVESSDPDSALGGPITLSLRNSSPYPLPNAIFSAALSSAPEERQTIGTAAFSAAGVAELVIDDPQALLTRFSAAGQEAELLISARIDGLSTQDASLALSEPLRLTLQPPAPTPTPETFAPPPVPIIPDWRLPAALLVGLLALNVLFALWIRRKRIQRMIDHPDRSEMSPRLMAITIYRDGVKTPHTLSQKTVTLGRGTGNDINLGEDTRISRHHGVVMWRRGHWYYSNRKPRLWVRINGRRYSGYVRVRLEPVTEIEVGQTLLLFHSSAQQDLADFIKTNL